MTPVNGLSREEFYQAFNDLKGDMKTAVADAKADLQDDVRGINDRLDVLNGRTGRGEVANAALTQRVTGLEKEIYQRPRRRIDEIADERRGVTKKDLGLAGMGLTLAIASLKLLTMLGQFLFEVAKAAVRHP